MVLKMIKKLILANGRFPKLLEKTEENKKATEFSKIVIYALQKLI
jgi:hypothetical protein